MLAVCYYPEHWPEKMWADDARRMADLGIRHVRIGEFAWGRIEPEPDRFDWTWLDRAVETLAHVGLKIVMCTPTATPPKWLVDRHPDILPVDAEGRPRRFGSRRHYCFSSPAFRAESARITERVAQRYGTHDAVAGWQTDNEYGCHDTVLSYSDAALQGFRGWLDRRYGDIAALNTAWGNGFWSMEYGDWAEIDLPQMTVTEASPAHRLDFQRYSSAMVDSFNRAQVEIIRRLSPGRWVTHNFMGRFLDFDHFDVAESLDLASWDSYPLGFTDTFGFDAAVARRYATTGHPDIAGFHHDLYRGVGRGRFWVMEQQPGPVNWAAWNPAPAPGMVRQWTWEALAHGAETVSYFRWRQAPYAQEQMHAGLNRPDNTLDTGGEEAAQVARELDGLTLPDTARAPVALIFDYEAAWILDIQPQGADFSYLTLVYDWYGALRRQGLDVDIVRPGQALDGYAMAVAPSLPLIRPKTLAALRAFTGPMLFGPRTASKTESFHIPDTLPPGALRSLLPLTVTRVESLRPGLERTVTWGNTRFASTRWVERLETESDALARFEDGSPALVAADNRYYLACWPDEALLDAVVAAVAERADLALTPLPEGVRVRRRGSLRFAFNRSPETVDVPAPAGADFVLGDRRLPPQGVSIWRE